MASTLPPDHPHHISDKTKVHGGTLSSNPQDLGGGHSRLDLHENKPNVSKPQKEQQFPVPNVETDVVIPIGGSGRTV